MLGFALLTPIYAGLVSETVFTDRCAGVFQKIEGDLGVPVESRMQTGGGGGFGRPASFGLAAALAYPFSGLVAGLS
ncbi:MAG: hypothetical protein LBI87_05470 [Candidatus Accumulibacter sp.]|jgi:hypothetical protein|nr:hypothetical protein [Accumulibacter sp.]